MNLIFGLCSNYNYSILKPLIRSLKSNGYKDHIVLFISNLSASTVRALENEGIELIHYQDTYPYFDQANKLIKYINPTLSGKYLSPNSLRYIFYEAYLKLNEGKFDWILHTDTRDVIFQGDPFTYYNKKGIYCFLEDLSSKIKDNVHNSYWIKFGFGDDVFDQMANQPISCSGVSLGSEAAFRHYLKKMVEYIVSLPNTGGLDQGIHNYLIFTHQIDDLNLIGDDEGPVTTLTTFKPYQAIKFNKDGKLINNHQEVLKIVHQYDRHLSLLWKFNKPAFYGKIKNLTKRKILQVLGKKV